MILFHGSYTEIKEIDLSKAAPQKDFGMGFYCTSVREHAETWAIRMAQEQKQEQDDDKVKTGVVSLFSFNYDKAFLEPENYKTKKFDGYTHEWLEFVELNRKNRTGVQAHDYDVVEGPVADDAVSAALIRYESGELPADTLLRILKHDGSHQVCFCTRRSLDTIERVNYKTIFKIGDMSLYVIYYLKANDGMDEDAAQELFYESQTYGKLVDEDTGLYMKPWEDIYQMLKEEVGS